MNRGAEARQSEDAPATQARPQHEQVYLDLRNMVLFGDLAPGQPVTIQGLTDTLGCGVTPVREAIRRLMSEGALAFHGNRRVSVPVLTDKDMQEILFVRKTVEHELTKRAAGVMQGADIDRLQVIDRALDVAIDAGDTRGYLLQNYRFHMTLYSYANAPVLEEVTDRLWLRYGPSLRIFCGRLGTQNLPDWHKDILDNLRRGDDEGAAAATVRDMEQGMAHMLEATNSTTQTPDSIDIE